MNISIVVPCCNEADNVGKLRDELLPVARALVRRHAVELVYVDDGSTDDTWHALTDTFQAGEMDGVAIHFERHAVNRGLGAALRTGFGAAKGDVIVTTDSDGTYPFDEIPKLLSCLTADVDIVTASPYHPDGSVVGVAAYRLLLSRGSSLLYRMLLSRKVHTYTSMFRAYRRSVVTSVPFESNGFLSCTEVLVGAMLRGFRVAEYPAVLHKRAFGQSKAKIARTIGSHLAFLGRIVLYRLRVIDMWSVARRSRSGAE